MTDTITYVSRRDRRRAARKSIASANAASAGRTTAAVLAASGLVISTGVAANATEDSDEGRESATVQLNASELKVERSSNNADVAVTASSDVELSFDRPVVTSEAAPEAEAEPEVESEPAIEAAPASQQAEQPVEQEQPAEQEQPVEQEEPQEQQEPEQEQEQAEPAEQSSEPQEQDNGEGATTAGESEEPPASGGSSSVVGAAYGYIGIPWSQMDCSALVQNAYAQAGVSVPRDTYGQRTLPQVSSPAPGDIVISNGGAHAAIYIGNGQVISSTSSQGIRVHGLHEGWHNVDSYHRPG